MFGCSNMSTFYETCGPCNPYADLPPKSCFPLLLCVSRCRTSWQSSRQHASRITGCMPHLAMPTGQVANLGGSDNHRFHAVCNSRRLRLSLIWNVIQIFPDYHRLGATQVDNCENVGFGRAHDSSHKPTSGTKIKIANLSKPIRLRKVSDFVKLPQRDPNKVSV